MTLPDIERLNDHRHQSVAIHVDGQARSDEWVLLRNANP
jgi:hypothetical protein